MKTDKSEYRQQIENLIYRIRTRFLYYLFEDENIQKDCNKLIKMLPSDFQKEVVILFRENKLNSHLENWITSDYLLDENVSRVVLKSNTYQRIKDDPNVSDSKIIKNTLSLSERILLGPGLSFLSDKDYVYVNGYRVMGAEFELIEYTKKLAELFGVQFRFQHTKYLDNLIFNYFEVYRAWRVESFAKNFLSNTIIITYADGNSEEVEYSIETKRAELAYFLFNNPSKEERKTQNNYFLGLE